MEIYESIMNCKRTNKNPFLATYFGSGETEFSSPDEGMKNQLEIISKKFYEQNNLLNGLKASFHQERINWDTERVHMKMKVDLLNKSIAISQKEFIADGKKIYNQNKDLETVSAKHQNELLQLKEEYSKREENFTKQNTKLREENILLRNSLVRAFNPVEKYEISVSHLAAEIQNRKNDIIPGKVLLDKNDNANTHLCCSCVLTNQKMALMKIIESQRERLLEKDAKIRTLKLTDQAMT